MGYIVKSNQPCEVCGSSDAKQVYADGTHCFSCGVNTRAKSMNNAKSKSPPAPRPSQVTPTAVRENYKTSGMDKRGIPKSICEFYKVKMAFDNEGNPVKHYYPYGEGYKVRTLPKTFASIGKLSGLFGQELFPAGGKRLVITEGEIDALSVATASYKKYQKHYPIVSVPSATGLKTLTENRSWIRSFKEVVIMFDQDTAGKAAADQAVSIIGYDKARVAVYNHKDPNEVLLKEGTLELIRIIWDAETRKPDSVVGKAEVWDMLMEHSAKVSMPYPECLNGLNNKIEGMRMGEITLFVSGTGCGKSTISREIIRHLIHNTKDRIGVIALEESPAETAMALAKLELGVRDKPPIEDIRKGFDVIFGDDDRLLLLNHSGSIQDGSLTDHMEYMALLGCKYFILDHITILTAEGIGDSSGNEAIDSTMNSLLRFVKKNSVWLGLISHLRKTQPGGTSFEQGKMPSLDDIKGSGSIKQISFDIVAFARDTLADDEETRNTIRMAVLKSRFTGNTGPVVGSKYDATTGRLSYNSEDF